MPEIKPSDRYNSLFEVWASWDRRRDGTWVERKPPLNWQLLKKQAIAESGLDPDAISPVGAKGLAQVMDATWREWADNEFGAAPPPRQHVSVFDPEEAIRAQADIMAWLLGLWKGDVRKALSSYNWGLGHMRACLEKHGEYWEAHLPLETSGYLKKILDR